MAEFNIGLKAEVKRMPSSGLNGLGGDGGRSFSYKLMLSSLLVLVSFVKSRLFLAEIINKLDLIKWRFVNCFNATHGRLCRVGSD